MSQDRSRDEEFMAQQKKLLEKEINKNRCCLNCCLDFWTLIFGVGFLATFFLFCFMAANGNKDWFTGNDKSIKELFYPRYGVLACHSLFIVIIICIAINRSFCYNKVLFIILEILLGVVFIAGILCVALVILKSSEKICNEKAYSFVESTLIMPSRIYNNLIEVAMETSTIVNNKEDLYENEEKNYIWNYFKTICFGLWPFVAMFAIIEIFGFIIFYPLHISITVMKFNLYKKITDGTFSFSTRRRARDTYVERSISNNTYVQQNPYAQQTTTNQPNAFQPPPPTNLPSPAQPQQPYQQYQPQFQPPPPPGYLQQQQQAYPQPPPGYSQYQQGYQQQQQPVGAPQYQQQYQQAPGSYNPP
ncbi:hypothetical protein TRFO_07246 [Tritrichomonas foetus]|uniref:Uncharacterized protein n=1 Tax=Tritrichomonas foetus TaxID=1144522 RepID=A0A1J4JSJ3_9EUKA|nr:hypothetical protein TRFO_07246 [Tritrichomonas foetus]|eukprot:OHT02073.1 hypothetical protein TRFO_07246 [Tritrichomonas foetus]